MQLRDIAAINGFACSGRVALEGPQCHFKSLEAFRAWCYEDNHGSAIFEAVQYRESLGILHTYQDDTDDDNFSAGLDIGREHHNAVIVDDFESRGEVLNIVTVHQTADALVAAAYHLYRSVVKYREFVDRVAAAS